MAKKKEEVPTKPEDADELVEAILDAIGQLDPDQEENWNKDGSPSVVVLESVLGYDITEAERDLAWEKLNEENVSDEDAQSSEDSEEASDDEETEPDTSEPLALDQIIAILIEIVQDLDPAVVDNFDESGKPKLSVAQKLFKERTGRKNKIKEEEWTVALSIASVREARELPPEALETAVAVGGHVARKEGCVTYVTRNEHLSRFNIVLDEKTRVTGNFNSTRDRVVFNVPEDIVERFEKHIHVRSGRVVKV